MDWLIVIVCLVVCYFSGNIIEKNHYKKIREREIKFYKKPYITFGKNVVNASKVEKTEFVTGEVVIGCDYFKMFLAGLRNLFGGNISAYESVLDRGRREAILRMREQAYSKGAQIIINVKIETVMLSPLGSNDKAPKVSVLAYGTAVKYAR